LLRESEEGAQSALMYLYLDKNHVKDVVEWKELENVEEG
jgi:hypothetical protein